jgi:hypothetical protein
VDPSASTSGAATRFATSGSVRCRPSARSTSSHDRARRVGEVVHLHESPNRDTWAVASVEAELPAGLLYLSASYSGPDEDARLVAVAVTASPAMPALPAVRFFDGDLRRLGLR